LGSDRGAPPSPSETGKREQVLSPPLFHSPASTSREPAIWSRQWRDPSALPPTTTREGRVRAAGREEGGAAAGPAWWPRRPSGGAGRPAGAAPARSGDWLRLLPGPLPPPGLEAGPGPPEGATEAMGGRWEARGGRGRGDGAGVGPLVEGAPRAPRGMCVCAAVPLSLSPQLARRGGRQRVGEVVSARRGRAFREARGPRIGKGSENDPGACLPLTFLSHFLLALSCSASSLGWRGARAASHSAMLLQPVTAPTPS
jgi:hypothetical protein